MPRRPAPVASSRRRPRGCPWLAHLLPAFTAQQEESELIEPPRGSHPPEAEAEASLTPPEVTAGISTASFISTECGDRRYDVHFGKRNVRPRPNSPDHVYRVSYLLHSFLKVVQSLRSCTAIVWAIYQHSGSTFPTNALSSPHLRVAQERVLHRPLPQRLSHTRAHLPRP